MSLPTELWAALRQRCAELHPGPELRQAQIHRAYWAQLRQQARLAQLRSELRSPSPQDLGPLHNHALARRLLEQLQEQAPAYVQALLAQLEDIEALQLLSAPALQPSSKKPTRATAKTSRAGKARKTRAAPPPRG